MKFHSPNNRFRAGSNRMLRLSTIALAFVGASFAASGLAQTALDTGSVTVPPALLTPTTDLTVIKTSSTDPRVPSGFTLAVTNTGPDPVTGAVVSDAIGSGSACPAGNPVTIAGHGVPAGSFTISRLTGPGIALGTLSSGQTATLTYSCKAN